MGKTFRTKSTFEIEKCGGTWAANYYLSCHSSEFHWSKTSAQGHLFVSCLVRLRKYFEIKMMNDSWPGLKEKKILKSDFTLPCKWPEKLRSNLPRIYFSRTMYKLCTWSVFYVAFGTWSLKRPLYLTWIGSCFFFILSKGLKGLQANTKLEIIVTAELISFLFHSSV